MDALKRVWLFGYVAFLVNFFISLCTRSFASLTYRFAVISIITSQCIVIYLGHLNQIRSLPELLSKLRNEETFYHLSFCVPLFFSGVRHYFLLLPFVIFSAYHVVFTLKDSIKALPTQLNYLHELMKKEQSRMLIVATYLEILAIPYLLIKFLRKQAGLGMLFSSIQFVRHQYSINRRTQIAFYQIRLFADGMILKYKANIPVPIVLVYHKMVHFTERIAPTVAYIPPKQK